MQQGAAATTTTTATATATATATTPEYRFRRTKASVVSYCERRLYRRRAPTTARPEPTPFRVFSSQVNIAERSNNLHTPKQRGRRSKRDDDDVAVGKRKRITSEGEVVSKGRGRLKKIRTMTESAAAVSPESMVTTSPVTVSHSTSSQEEERTMMESESPSTAAKVTSEPRGRPKGSTKKTRTMTTNNLSVSETINPSRPTTTTTAAATAIPVSQSDPPNVAPAAGKKSMSSIIQHLERRHASLLTDHNNDPRAAFMELPASSLCLLQKVWNLGDTPSVDQVSHKLRNEPTAHPIHVTTTILEIPGFPRQGADSMFSRFKLDAALAQRELKTALSEKLMKMGYYTDRPCHQQISFYLSFLTTRYESRAQDPHVNFPWPQVQPPPFHDDAYKNHDNHDMHIFPTTNEQRPWTTRHANLPYKERVPFVAFFPLTLSGMRLELWSSNKNMNQHQQQRGVMVDIPMGILLLVRGDVIHAGGFMKDPMLGDPRGHLYIYSGRDDQAHETHLQSNYHLPPPSTERLSTIYCHALNAPTGSTQDEDYGKEYMMNHHNNDTGQFSIHHRNALGDTTSDDNDSNESQGVHDDNSPKTEFQLYRDQTTQQLAALKKSLRALEEAFQLYQERTQGQIADLQKQCQKATAYY